MTRRVRSPALALLAFGLLAPAAGCAHTNKHGLHVAERDCSGRDFDPVSIERAARSSVVQLRVHEQLVNQDAVGSGFVLADDDSKYLHIVTNYHVIGAADSVEAVLDVDGRQLTVSDVEIVKVDPSRDLALLRAPEPPGADLGLELTHGRAAGQRVAVLGYPYVQGADPAMTVEEGSVSSAELVLDQSTYISTNANINPGNSGGPMVDACGDVMGVVVARHSETERTGLAIPVAHVEDLYAAFKAPRAAPEAEVDARLRGFFEAIRFDSKAEAAGVVSQEFLAQRLVTPFQDFATRVSAIEQAYRERQVDLGRATPEEYMQLVGAALPEHERELLVPYMLFQVGALNSYQTLQAFLAAYLRDLFGPVDGVELRVRARDDSHATATARVTGGGGTSMWTFEMAYRRGEWFIDSMATDQAPAVAAAPAPAATPFELFVAGRHDEVVIACALPADATDAEIAWWLEQDCPAYASAVHFTAQRESDAVTVFNRYCNIDAVKSQEQYRTELVAKTLVLIYAQYRSRNHDRKHAWQLLRDPLESLSSPCHLSPKKMTQHMRPLLDQYETELARRTK